MNAAAPKLAFDNGGAFIQETRREVEQYLARGSTRIKGALMLYAKAPIALALTAVSWSVLMFVHPGVIGIALCLARARRRRDADRVLRQHDANHGAYFKRRRWNHLVGWSADLLLGFSSYAWRVKHNVAHHTYTNVDGVRRRRHPGSARPLHAVPARAAVVPLPAVLHLADVHAHGAALADGRRPRRVRRGCIGESALRVPRGWDLVGLFAGKAFFIAWALVIPLLVYPWWGVLAAYVGFAMITSLIMATTFQLAHCVEEASFASAGRAPPRAADLGRARGRDDRRLLPAQPGADLDARRAQLPDRAPPVPAGAAHALPEDRRDRAAQLRQARRPLLVSLRRSARALRSHFLHLRTMGRLGLPAEIEMG